jgi:hypothetical protein
MWNKIWYILSVVLMFVSALYAFIFSYADKYDQATFFLVLAMFVYMTTDWKKDKA